MPAIFQMDPAIFLTDHANVKYLQYIFSVPNDAATKKNTVAGTEALQLNRTWNTSLSIEF